MNHYRKTMKLYKRRQVRSDGCPFCKGWEREKPIYQDDFVYIVPNLTKYDLWEFHDVTDHLLVMPKRHVESLSELGQDERLALMEVIATYEKKGYSAYARGVGFVKRSVKHQHTHLIKTSNKKPRFALFSQKPYTVIKK